MRGFGEWQKRAMGNVGPILTYAVRYSTFVPGSGFVYGDPNPRNEKYFSIALIGLSFLSRHFM